MAQFTYVIKKEDSNDFAGVIKKDCLVIHQFDHNSPLYKMILSQFHRGISPLETIKHYLIYNKQMESSDSIIECKNTGIT